MADEKRNNFNTWLRNKLDLLNLDSEVYLDYITGVLEDEENEEELKETLADVLSGVLEENVEETTDEIFKKFVICKEDEKKQVGVQKNNEIVVNADDKIKSLITKQKEQIEQTAKDNANSTKLVDNEMKKLVLNQYRNRSNSQDGEQSGDEQKSDNPTEFQNMNAEAVMMKEQEKRDKAKKASDEKKVQDKFNRDKDKQKKEERAEKEKKRTQKGERKAR